MIQDNNGPKADAGKLRKLIRKKVAEILSKETAPGSGIFPTDAGARVFPNASVPPWSEELPVILIYPRSEADGKYAEAPRELERDLDLAIEIVATGPEVNPDLKTPATGKKTLEDILDDIAEQVECEMSRDETLGGTADESILTGTEMEFESAGGQPIGSARLTYSVTYYTMSPRSVDKQIETPDFEQGETEWHIGDVDENTREAKDTIEPETT